MHKNWCGEVCESCETPCELDKDIPCSPDCEELGENGEHNSPECWKCAAYPAWDVPVSFDGAITIHAETAEEARDIAMDMDKYTLRRYISGSWSVGHGFVVKSE